MSGSFFILEERRDREDETCSHGERNGKRLIAKMKNFLKESRRII
jgi:hypothetical protein